MKNNLESIINNIKYKYSYLKLSDIDYLELIKIASKHKNIELYIDNIIKTIVSGNKDIKIPEFMTHFTREEIILNYIDNCLTYSKDINDNLIQVTKLYYFYKLIEEEQEIINLNSNLLLKNKTFKHIINNLRINSDKIDNNNHFIQMFLYSYSITFPDEIFTDNLYDSRDNFSIYRNDIRNLPTYTESEKQDLLIQALNGNIESKKKYIEANLKLVVAIAFNYQKNYSMNIMDLIQAGNEGLIKAIDKFDITKGNQFSTYATWWIKKEICDFIQNNRCIKISNYTYSRLRKVKKCQKWLEEHNIPSTLKNISKKTKLSIKDVEELLSIPLSVESLDIKVYEDEQEGKTIVDTIKHEGCLIQEVEDKMMEEKIYDILKKMYDDKFLSERDIKVLILYLGLKVESMTYEKIGKILNISGQRVHQIYIKILEKIRTSKYINEFADFKDNYSLINQHVKIKQKGETN